MGCDIHSFIEYKDPVPNVWVLDDAFDDDYSEKIEVDNDVKRLRSTILGGDYGVFGVLAGVRSSHVATMVRQCYSGMARARMIKKHGPAAIFHLVGTARGLPVDLSAHLSMYMLKHTNSYHTPSHMSYLELLFIVDMLKTYSLMCKDSVHRRNYDRLDADSIRSSAPTIRRMKKLEKTHRTRLVFWFDS